MAFCPVFGINKVNNKYYSYHQHQSLTAYNYQYIQSQQQTYYVEELLGETNTTGPASRENCDFYELII